MATKTQTIDQIQVMKRGDPLPDPMVKDGARMEFLQSRSGATITVFERMTKDEYAEFNDGNEGHRSYLVAGIPNGNIGGSEFHPTAKEVLFVLKGSMDWRLEDLDGNKRTLQLQESNLVFYIPPLTLHQYVSTSEGTTLLVQRSAHLVDTFYEDKFRELQAQHNALTKRS